MFLRIFSRNVRPWGGMRGYGCRPMGTIFKKIVWYAVEQNKLGDVAGENTQKHKRTSSEISSSPDKARRDLFGDLKFL